MRAEIKNKKIYTLDYELRSSSVDSAPCYKEFLIAPLKSSATREFYTDKPPFTGELDFEKCWAELAGMMRGDSLEILDFCANKYVIFWYKSPLMDFERIYYFRYRIH